MAQAVGQSQVMVSWTAAGSGPLMRASGATPGGRLAPGVPLTTFRPPGHRIGSWGRRRSLCSAATCCRAQSSIFGHRSCVRPSFRRGLMRSRRTKPVTESGPLDSISSARLPIRSGGPRRLRRPGCRRSWSLRPRPSARPDRGPGHLRGSRPEAVTDAADAGAAVGRHLPGEAPPPLAARPMRRTAVASASGSGARRSLTTWTSASTRPPGR